MSSNRSSEFQIFTDFQFPNKKFGDREYSEDFLLLIGHSVSMHLLLARRESVFIALWMERLAFCLETRFKTGRAITIVAGPVLCPVQIAAAAARVGILDLLQFEELFPIWALFLQRSRAVTNLDPLYAPVIQLPRLRHIP